MKVRVINYENGATNDFDGWQAGLDFIKSQTGLQEVAGKEIDIRGYTLFHGCRYGMKFL